MAWRAAQEVVKTLVNVPMCCNSLDVLGCVQADVQTASHVEAKSALLVIKELILTELCVPCFLR